MTKLPPTSQLGSGGAVAEGLPALLVLLKLLHPAHVEPPVPLGHVQHQQVEDLALLHHGQLQLGPGEALGVVAVETLLPHVDAGDEDLILWALGGGGQEGPFDHGQGGVPAPLGHHAGQRHVLALLGHGEGGGRDGDVDGVADAWKEEEIEDDGFGGWVLVKGQPALRISGWCQVNSSQLLNAAKRKSTLHNIWWAQFYTK